MAEKSSRPGRAAAVGPKGPDLCRKRAIHKTRRKGRVVKIALRAVFGTESEIKAALEKSAVSKVINTAFIERQNGTDRNRNARKVRKTYCFSKDWDAHNAMT